GAGESEKRAAQERYAELNTAYNCLCEPKERLAHLIELESGVRPKQVQNIPSDLMDAFMEVTSLCRGVDAFLAEKMATTSPLLRLQLFEREQEWTEKLMLLQRKVNGWRGELMAKLKETNAAWGTGPSDSKRQETFGLLEKQCQLLGYFSRWSAQI